MITEQVEKLDKRFESFSESMRTPLGSQGFGSITSLGSIYFTGVLLLLLWSFGHTAAAKSLGSGFIVTFALVHAIKLATDRKRPEDNPRNILSRASFPSGHSANVFLTASILSSYWGKPLLFFSLAATVAFSRIYTENHYLSDVVAGSGIGLLIGLITTTV